jgi:hypothetical protein
VQRRRLTPRTLILGQIVALLGLVTIFGVYLWLTGQRVLGLLLVGAPMAVDGVLLERLANALPRRPLFPKVGYRFLTTGSQRVRAMVSAAVGLRDAPRSALPRLWRDHMV